MKDKIIILFAYLISPRFIVTVSYTLVVLPYTVRFFNDLAAISLENEFRLFGIIPLSKCHEYFLPIFLCALEFASIHLSITFWKKKEKAFEYILIILLFLFCQSYAMSSVYYDIRNKEFEEINKKNNDYEIKHITKIDKYENGTNRIITDLKNENKFLKSELSNIGTTLNRKEKEKKTLTQEIDEISGKIIELSVKNIGVNAEELKKREREYQQYKIKTKNNDTTIRYLKKNRKVANRGKIDEQIAYYNNQTFEYERKKKEYLDYKERFQQYLSDQVTLSELHKSKEIKNDALKTEKKFIKRLNEKKDNLLNQIGKNYKQIRENERNLLEENQVNQNKTAINSNNSNNLNTFETTDIGINTNLNYIVNNLFENSSYFAFFLVFLFPISILAIGFVLAKREVQSNEEMQNFNILSNFNIEKELEKCADVLRESHIDLAKIFESRILLYFKGLVYESNTSSIISDYISGLRCLENIAQSSSIMIEQIEKSQLSDDAKIHLISYINKLIMEKAYYKNNEL